MKNPVAKVVSKAVTVGFMAPAEELSFWQGSSGTCDTWGEEEEEEDVGELSPGSLLDGVGES